MKNSVVINVFEVISKVTAGAAVCACSTKQTFLKISQKSILLKSDSDTGVSLWILRKF